MIKKICLILILTIFILYYVSFAVYGVYYKMPEELKGGKVVTIPNSNDISKVPQGLCKISYSGKEYWLGTAYDSERKKDSVIYIYEKNSEDTLTYYKTVYIDGTAGEHFGGITEYKNYIWVVSTDCFYKILKPSLFNSIKPLCDNHAGLDKNDSSIRCANYYKKYLKSDLNNSFQGNLSFCTTSTFNNQEILWIGTFARVNDNLYVNASKPTAYGYVIKGEILNSNYEFIEQFIEVGKMEIPWSCQGMTFIDNYNVLFSTSNGNANSKIRFVKYERLDHYFDPIFSDQVGFYYEYHSPEEQGYSKTYALSQNIYYDSPNLYINYESGNAKFNHYTAKLRCWNIMKFKLSN